jgi:hypothetical protein
MKNPDPGKEIQIRDNIPDPHHWIFMFFNTVRTVPVLHLPPL